MFKNVVVAMSGGVDSAVATLFLKNKGFNVTAVFMKNWDIVDETGHCVAEKEYNDAELICKKLEIPLIQVNFVKEFWNNVFSDFMKDYELGLTPNPDVQCNRKIKFDMFYNYARDELNADAIATGHYVRTSFGPYLEKFKSDSNVILMQAEDFKKDQSFFLSQVSQEPLRRTMFPLGDYIKKDVKEIAANAGLHSVAQKKESMGICFIGSRHFQEFISQYIEDKPGDFIDFDTGLVVGKHNGFHHWTVGQGCRIPGSSHAYFILRKHLKNNAIYVVKGTNHSALYTDLIITSSPHWINQEPIQLRDSKLLKCDFRFQHRRPLVSCTVYKSGKNQLIIRINEPQRAITPGQFAALYLEDECLGSAKILYPGPSYHFLGKEVKLTSYNNPNFEDAVEKCEM